jgi:two-component system, sensor histidine kinase and response regulator
VIAGADPFNDAVQVLASRLPGINVTRGLSLLRGNAEKYLALLGQFVELHRDDAAKLMAHLDRDDLDGAGRLTHSLRGTAGTLGIESVADAARRIDTVLRSKIDANNTPSFRQQAQMAVQILGDQMGLLAAALPPRLSPMLPAASVAHTPESQQTLLAELDLLLAHNDTAVVALLHDHATTLRQALGPRFDAVANHVTAFDFESARTALQRP